MNEWLNEIQFEFEQSSANDYIRWYYLLDISSIVNLKWSGFSISDIPYSYKTSLTISYQQVQWSIKSLTENTSFRQDRFHSTGYYLIDWSALSNQVG